MSYSLRSTINSITCPWSSLSIWIWADDGSWSHLYLHIIVLYPSSFFSFFTLLFHLTLALEGFSKVLKTLSAESTREELLAFLQEYGSHYVSEALYGSELSCSIYFPSKKAQQQLWLQYQKGELTNEMPRKGKKYIWVKFKKDEWAQFICFGFQCFSHSINHLPSFWKLERVPAP